MVIIKSIKTKIGRTGREKTRISLNDRLKKINPNLEENEIKKKIAEYPKYKIAAKELIVNTEKMLKIFSEKPELRNAQFIFLERDASPYMWIAKEICQNYKLRKEQFKSLFFTANIRFILNRMMPLTEIEPTKEKSDSLQLKYLGQKIKQQSIPELNEKSKRKLWDWEIKELQNTLKAYAKIVDINRPVVVIDTGFVGNSVKRVQALLYALNPRIKQYSAMFYISTGYEKYHDFNFSPSESAKGICKIENLPKFKGKIKSTRKIEERIIPERYEDSASPVNAEIFMIALRNMLARYKHEKEIK